MPPVWFYPDTPDLPLPPGDRFPAHKYRLLRTALRDQSLVSAAHLIASPAATRDQLLRAHDATYVDGVLDGTLDPKIQRQIGLPLSDVLVARSLATVGGTLAASRLALKVGISGQLAGGTHHAHRDQGSGFCVFNDCAVAALTLLDEGAIARAAILDLDVHQGDGNATILADEPRVMTASVHGARNYPFQKAISTLDIALPDGTEDEPYLEACTRALDAVVAFEPNLVFYIAGVDPLWCDRLGRFAVSHAGLEERDRQVLTHCRDARIPIVVLIGGGYADPIEETVRAYATTIKTANALFP